MAATLVEPGRIELREYPYPDPLEPGAVLLRMLASYEPTLRLLARHHRSLPLARAITHRFPLSQAAEAMETALRGDGAMKVVIEPQRRE
jgi:hypothetical protein